MVDAVLHIFHVLMRHGHTQLKEFLGDFFLRVLKLVLQEVLSLFDLFSQCELCHLVVHLRQLLHLKVVFADQVLLLLGYVTQILCW